MLNKASGIKEFKMATTKRTEPIEGNRANVSPPVVNALGSLDTDKHYKRIKRRDTGADNYNSYKIVV